MKKNHFTPRAMPLPGLGSALIGREEEELVLDVLRRGELSRFYGRDPHCPPPMATTLEREFCAMMGTRYALGVTSGSAALEVALGALGIGPGDEVILTAWSWLACFTSIVRVGARPVLAEIDESFSLAPGEITRLATEQTKAALIVHYQGVPADMDPLLSEAAAAGIQIVEDCAQSPGATYRGRRVGSMGAVGTFSFQYLKSITSGEGGMVVTDDPVLYERAIRMHDLGQVRPYFTQFIEPQVQHFAGSQFRMNEMCAAVALAQLRKLEKLREHCRALQSRVVSRILGLPGITMRSIPDPAGDSGFEIYFFLPDASLAAAFTQRLRELNVPCSKGTSTYCHFTRDYCRLGLAHNPKASPFVELGAMPAPGYREEDFPRTNELIRRYVALPIGALYTEADADYIAECVCQVHSELMSCTS